MTHKARLVSGVLLAAMLAAGAATALESGKMLPLMNDSVTGSYLAGRQALADLRTEDAAQYFRTAANADWDNMIVVERSFVAEAANGNIPNAARVAKHLLELSAPNDLASLVIAAEALKRADAPYVGMVGSRTKRARFRSWYFAEAGGTQEQFERLVLPIGGRAFPDGLGDKRPEVIAALAAAEILVQIGRGEATMEDLEPVAAMSGADDGR